ncbi:hypothetical protein L2712_17440 [Shewanella marisflavi]|uniref:hypothetical protein n=1 Tax=Shewanella marisflavi TaxID=260364 RepID=UPI00200EC69A|nr:hypothetical protein [Shewanella marisflavi]MCL1043417.1 hypothetical protein [Shewanella marisflavi]
MSEQVKGQNIDSFDNWLIWLKRAAYLGIIVFLSVLISYFANFAQWPWRLSPLPEDWSSFGSVLAGASAFLAAIGTVGVLLISIKQFKLQQKQIEEQAKRQDEFEELQKDKWDKENEMLNFQKYQMHYSSFEELLDNYCNDNKVEITSRNKLYKKLFPNNTFENTCLSNDEADIFEGEINHLINFYLRCLKELKAFNTDKDIAVLNASNLITTLLHINPQQTLKNGDIEIKRNDDFIFSGLNLHNADSTMRNIGDLIRNLQRFSGHTREWGEDDSLKYHKINLAQFKDDISSHSARVYSNNKFYSDILDLQFVIYKVFGNEIENTLRIIESDESFANYYESIKVLISNNAKNMDQEKLEQLNTALGKLAPAYYAICS